MSKKEKLLLVVVGPTAVGKTALAIELAKHYATDIISADSRQFYREMSIGTAKPNADELAQAKHYFINSHSVEEIYSAGDFERDGLTLLEQLFQDKDIVVMVGGSGLFVRALCEGFDDLPQAPVEVREAYNKRFAEEGIIPLQAELKAVDPIYYAEADVDNPQRIIRALEVFQATGKPFSSFRQQARNARPFNVLTIGLNMEREKLYDRINQRVDIMLADGLLDEVKSLEQHRDKPALLTVGYAEIFDYSDGTISLETAIDKIKQNSRRYAKRQITWFKKFGNTHWFQPGEFAEIIAWVENSRRESAE